MPGSGHCSKDLKVWMMAGEIRAPRSEPTMVPPAGVVSLLKASLL
jgi:hypothetical protein